MAHRVTASRLSSQAKIYVVLLANAVGFSVLGGALLTRYLLPLYPLILLLAVSTFRRRVRCWQALCVLSAVAFLLALFINPPYRFAPEDNLAYRDVIQLHQQAIRQIVLHQPGATVLTAWPASDEISKPELGYIRKPLPAFSIDNFSSAELARASAHPGAYTAALVFSTKYDPPHLPLNLGEKNRALDEKYFGFHHDLSPWEVAQLLGGTVTWHDERDGQWAAVLQFAKQPAPQPLNCRGHYNQLEVRPIHSMRFIVRALLLVFLCVSAPAQNSAANSAAAPARNGRLLLVMPFENLTSQQNLDWIGESVSEVLNQRLASAGFLPITRTDRLYALDHLGLPQNFQPSRASMLRLAQNLDADYVIYGSYTMSGNNLTATAHILDLPNLKVGPAAHAAGGAASPLGPAQQPGLENRAAARPHLLRG